MTRKLIIHQFKYMKDGEEVFLSGNSLLIKVYGIVAGIELDFVREFHPENTPCAYLEGVELDVEDVLTVLKIMRPLPSESDREQSLEREALGLWIRKTLTEILDYNLFKNTACLEKFTNPILRSSMSRPAADVYLLQRRLNANPPEAEMVEKMKNLLTQIHELIGNYKFNNDPNLLDITMYAFLSPLFAIPPDLTFWEDKSLPLQKVRAFLLDFDDWLWCHAMRPPLPAVTPKLPTFLKADASLAANKAEPVDDANPSKEFEQTHGIVKNHNLYFGAFCFISAVAAVISGKS
jgi:hypothetical protein